jgi:DNA-directed RNA polymerase sigma subunit (sigma70/sigma32)
MKPMTLKEIAQKEGVSHQMIDLILRRAIYKFKQALIKKGLKFEDVI